MATPNIQYARPIEIDYRPFQLYLQKKEAQQRNKLAQRRLDMQEQRMVNSALAKRQENINKALSNLSDLNKYGTGGLFGDQIGSTIEEAQKELSKKILANDQSWHQDLADYTQRLNNMQNKAEAYGKLIDQKVSDYAKNKAIDPGALRNYLLERTAFGPEGNVRSLSEIDLPNLSKVDPLTMPGADSFINNAEATDQLLDLYPLNTVARSNTNQATGNSTATTINAPAYVRIDPATGKRALNVEAVGADPVLRDDLFDEYRDSDGKVRLIKEPIYESAKGNPIFRSRLIREIQEHNEGLQPSDPGYVEPNSHEAGLIGRALLTQALTGKLRGDFRITNRYGKKDDSGDDDDSGGDKGTLGLLQKFKGVMQQDPEFLKYKTDYSGLITPTQFVDVTPIFKDFNVALNSEGKAIPAKQIVIRKDDPGKILVDYGDGLQPQEVTLQELPNWLNNKVQFNKDMDAQKLVKGIQKVFGNGITTQQADEPQLSQKEKKKAAKKGIASAVKNFYKGLMGTTKQDTVDFRNQFKADK